LPQTGGVPFLGLVFAMKVSSVLVLAGVTIMAAARAADATTPVDYTQRNTPFAAGSTVPVEKKTLPTADAVQEKRMDLPTRDKPAASIGVQRAAVDVTETRAKTIVAPESHRPETRERPLNAFNHREAAMAPGTDPKKPPLVAKYQESLAGATVTKTSRMPALNRATTATINRFVFRKNPSEANGNAAALEGATITPAAGGSAIRK
jgi:hypothetical protein